jgi:deoxycytidine triphosphate deaminase
MGKLDSYPLEQWEFVLGKTYETVSINCPDLIGFIEGRSTYARMGLSVHQAPWIQPGWDATITLEILNVGPLTIELVPIVDRLCQITFFELKTALEKDQLYGEKPGARYHHQKDALGST